MLWEAGAKKGDQPVKFGERDLREILKACLNRYYLSKLTHLDWYLSEQPYRASISKLESVEQDIIQTKE